jgi:hypothetical protein
VSAELLGRPPAVVSAGVEPLAAEVEAQGAPLERLAWRPPLDGAEEPLRRLIGRSTEIAAANDRAVGRMQAAQPLLVGVARAADVLPGVTERTILHSGPPLEWRDAAGPLRGAVIGALIYEDLADTPERAERLVAAGRVELSPCHEHAAVGPMAGVVSPSMPVWVVEDAAGGGRAHCTFNEGLGKVLRYGAYSQEVIERLRWMSDVMAPIMAAAVSEAIDLRAILSQALQMGDEGHNRHRAATALLIKQLLPALLTLDAASTDVAEVARFIAANDHTFLNLAMPAAKVMADAASGVPGSTIVTTLSRNGTEFGVRVSGTGEAWFTGPAQPVEGLYFPGYAARDASLDIGDSAITETVGLGGFAMAAAPAIASFIGGTPDEALAATTQMYDIAWAESEHWLVPALGFRGTPVGIDCRAVCLSGTLPVINSGIAHREPGIGQIGAGVVHPPARPFVTALEALAARS